jgi:hypothetical protein
MRKKSPAPRNRRVPPTRITAEEYDQIIANAQKAEKSLCAYVRLMCLHGKITVKQPRADFQLITEISRIGVNINQIAKIANQTGKVSPELTQALQLMDKVLSKLLDDAGV